MTVAFQKEIATTHLIPKVTKDQIADLYYSDNDILKFKADAIREIEIGSEAHIDDDHSSNEFSVPEKTGGTLGEHKCPKAPDSKNGRRPAGDRRRPQRPTRGNPRELRNSQDQFVDSSTVLDMLKNSDLYQTESGAELEQSIPSGRAARQPRPRSERLSREGASSRPSRPARAPRSSRPQRSTVAIVDTNAGAKCISAPI